MELHHEHDGNEPSSPDLEDMLNKAKELASFMRSGVQDMKQSFVQVEHDDDHDEYQRNATLQIKRTDNLVMPMRRNLIHVEEKNDSNDPLKPLLRSGDNPVDDMLLRAGNLAAQMRAPNEDVWNVKAEQTSTTTTKSLTISTDTDHWCPSDASTGYATPRGIVATVSLDEEDDDVETMLLKADLLSRTIRSAANGQLDTPELLRASDEILKRAKRNEGSIGCETTPLLLARAQKILTHPSSVAALGDVSVDTLAESMETDPVRNVTQLPSILNRPPRPPSTTRTPGGTQAITPSPKAKTAAAPDTEGLMERVIATLQRFPTTKTPDSPVMPNSVALKMMDSDDYSSVGSGSARSSTVDAPAYDTPERESSVNSLTMEESSAKSVEDAEDMALQMAKALQETLIHSQTLVPETNDTIDDVTSPALRPRQLSRCTDTPPTSSHGKSIVDNDHNQAALANAQMWDEHDAVSPQKGIYSTAVVTSPSKSVVAWETVSPIKVGDVDYAPIQDFRNSSSRSIGVGLMPDHDGGLGKKRSRRWKWSKLVRAFVVCMFLTAVLLLTAKPFFGGKDVATSDATTTPTNAAITESPVAIERVEKPQTIVPTFWEPQKEVPLALVPKKEKPRLKAEMPAAEIAVSRAVEIAPLVTIDDPPPVQNMIAVAATVPVAVPAAIGILEVVMPISNKIIRKGIPGRCFLPLGYIAFSKCRKVLRETILFDAHSLADCMLQ